MEPTLMPSVVPTSTPTLLPSQHPSLAPSVVPSIEPTLMPSVVPTSTPTLLPSQHPSLSSMPSSMPSLSSIPSFEPSDTPSISPTVDPYIAKSLRIGLGTAHTCAVINTNNLRCWGLNDAAQIGDGTTTNRLNPTPVLGLEGEVVVGVDSGSTHNCAIIRNGDVLMCWGHGGDGALGNGSYDQKSTPTPVVNLGGPVVAIGLGERHSCAIITGGALKCWGYNNFGQIGIGESKQRTINAPVAVNLGGPAYAVTSGGWQHACAITNEGDLKCWGLNSHGQIGDGTTTNRNTPTSVVGLGGKVEAVSAGELHTCAIINRSDLKCWGGGSDGQLGIGSTESRTTPSFVNLGGRAAAIDIGRLHTCAIVSGGTLKCWGSGRFSKLGNGSNDDRTTPTTVNLGGAAVALSLGMAHSCAIIDGGDLMCWGYGYYGRLGDGTTRSSSFPKYIITLDNI